jgi:hypothetical protein
VSLLSCFLLRDSIVRAQALSMLAFARVAAMSLPLGAPGAVIPLGEEAAHEMPGEASKGRRMIYRT